MVDMGLWSMFIPMIPCASFVLLYVDCLNFSLHPSILSHCFISLPTDFPSSLAKLIAGILGITCLVLTYVVARMISSLPCE